MTDDTEAAIAERIAMAERIAPLDLIERLVTALNASGAMRQTAREFFASYQSSTLNAPEVELILARFMTDNRRERLIIEERAIAAMRADHRKNPR